MYNWKKPLQKLLTITMVFGLLSPMILSTAVSAAENKEPIQEKIESTGIETESNAEKESIEEDIDTEEEVPKEEINNLESSEDKLSNEESNEDAVDKDDTSEEPSTSSDEQEISNSKTEDYFSLTENRENAIAIMETANEANDSSENKSESASIINNFIENVSAEAIAAAGEYQSIVSVLIAQAALESAWGTSVLVGELESYNLFGVKASEAEDFVQYYSKVTEQENATLENARFKKYSSYKEAFAENLLKLQQNPEWKNLKDSADSENYKNILNIISEEYSSVPDYKNMLNTIIETYDLTQYDKSVSENETESAEAEEEVANQPQQRSMLAASLKKAEVITSEKTIDYRAKIKRKTDTINTKPYGTEGYKRTAWSSEYYGKEVKVSKEAITDRATWALISVNGKELGWIDKSALDIEKITSSTDTSYYKRIGRKTDSITNIPWGTEGFKVLEMSSQYLGKQVRIIKEAKTRRATWVLVTLNGKELGWIDKKGLTDQEVILSEKTINYKAKITRKTDTINTKPYGTQGYKILVKSSAYYGKQVTITKEAVTDRATWAYISGLGWIDKAGLDIEKVISTIDASYYKRIGRKTDSISTLPWGTEGYKVTAKSSEYLGKQVKVIKEAKTRRATWALITLNGKEMGWIDKKGLTDYEIILSEKTTNYKAKINRKTDTINTKPYGTQGYKVLAKSSAYYGNQVTITKEAVTDRATWAYVSGLGWMDKAGLDIEKVTSQTNTNYKARITRSTDTINTKPWGTEGYKTVAYTKGYFGGEVTVTKEAKTSRATWAQITFNGKELGWIDIKALKKINLSKKVVVIDPGHGGKDPGAQAGGVKEANLNLIVAKKVQQKLEKAGYEVIMTRTTDKFLELSEIAGIANRSNADIFVSVHTNSFNGTANGIETYSYNKAGNPNNLLIANDPQRLLNSSLLSQSIQNSLIKKTGAFNRKAQKANFHVVRETGMPAVLVEIGFVDNTAERNKLVTNAYQEKLATGIVEGIQTYFK